MSIKVLFTILLLGSINPAPAQPAIKAFVDVNVIPMDLEKILEHQTVIIEGSTIIKIESFSTSKIPANALVIDGRNKYLIPGLMDMHVHFSSEKDLILYLSQGITTIRNLNGNDTHLSLRNQVNDETLLGPRIFTSGPLITNSKTPWRIKAVPDSPDSVRKIVQAQKKAGYDFIKVYDGLSKEIYISLMDEALKQNIPALGHIPPDVGLEAVLEHKQASIEHVEKIVYTYFNLEFDNAKIPFVANMIKKAGTWVCPTLAVQEIFKLNMEGEFLPMLKNPEMDYVDRGIMGWWKSFASPKKSGPMNEHQIKMNGFYDFQLSLTKGLFDAGVPILAGTDAPNPGMVHGFALHEELRNLVAAGLRPYEALKAATVNGAKFLKMENQIGTIKEGLIADLVLLDANPLEDISHTKRQAGVMVRGEWYSENKLKTIVETK